MSSGADVDGREPGVDNGFCNFLALDARNDAVTIPVRQPRRRIVAAALLHEVEGPWLVLANITDHSVQEATGIGVRRFDEQRNLGPAPRKEPTSLGGLGRSRHLTLRPSWQNCGSPRQKDSIDHITNCGHSAVNPRYQRKNDAK